MRSNVQNPTLLGSVRELDNNLSSIENSLKDMIRTSIEEITSDPTKQKEILSIWTNHAMNISDFFFVECERTGNKGLYKDIFKYVMFNKK